MGVMSLLPPPKVLAEGLMRLYGLAVPALDGDGPTDPRFGTSRLSELAVLDPSSDRRLPPEFCGNELSRPLASSVLERSGSIAPYLPFEAMVGDCWPANGFSAVLGGEACTSRPGAFGLPYRSMGPAGEVLFPKACFARDAVAEMLDCCAGTVRGLGSTTVLLSPTEVSKAEFRSAVALLGLVVVSSFGSWPRATDAALSSA